MPKTTKARYRATVGLSYPTKGGERRVLPGEVIDDLPGPSIKWLLTAGHIEKEGAK